MKLLLISCLFLISCAVEEIACEESDATIENICVYKNQFLEIDNHDLRKAINIIHTIWSEKFDVDIRDIAKRHKDLERNTQIEFVNELEYRGLTEDGYYITLLYNESDKNCIANTAIGHEMLHVLGGLYDMNNDHDNSELFLNWTGICRDWIISAENKINIELCNSVCEIDCIWLLVKECLSDKCFVSNFGSMCIE